MEQKDFLLFIFCFLLFFKTSIFSQQKDTIIPFQKEKWLLGLSGSFSSSTNKLKNNIEEKSTNNYGLEMKMGTFFKDRWLIGGMLLAERSNGKGSITHDFESLFFGPTASYYFSKNKQGSLFLNMTPGYIRYREETTIKASSISEKITGNGFGLVMNLGYSYPFKKYILFDIGLNLTNYWLRINKQSFPINEKPNKAVKIEGINFSFGFNVLLDNIF